MNLQQTRHHITYIIISNTLYFCCCCCVFPKMNCVFSTQTINKSPLISVVFYLDDAKNKKTKHFLWSLFARAQKNVNEYFVISLFVSKILIASIFKTSK